MAKIYNSDCTNELARNAGIQQNVDKVPNELAEKIVPTFETNPEILRKTNWFAEIHRAVSTGASSTLKTCATGKRTFITNIYLYVLKDAACDKATGEIAITLTPKGKAAIIIAQVPLITLTAQESNVVLSIPPMELEPGSNIVLGAFSYAAGVAANGCNAFGYEIDNARI